jgi:hypothetical protein
MKSSGCSLVHFGIEAGSQAVLDAVGKKTTIEQARRAVRLAREVGLRTACFFLFGIPGESRADMLATIRLARTLAPTYASFHMAIPYPHTPLARSFGPQREGEFPSHFAGHWSHRELQAWVRLGFGAFYLRPRAVWSTLREGRISDLSDLASVFWWYVS